MISLCDSSIRQRFKYIHWFVVCFSLFGLFVSYFYNFVKVKVEGIPIVEELDYQVIRKENYMVYLLGSSEVVASRRLLCTRISTFEFDTYSYVLWNVWRVSFGSFVKV